jgi:hypothetical protein
MEVFWILVLIGIVIYTTLAGALARGVSRFYHLAGQVFANRVAGQAGAACDLPNGYAVTQMPASNYTQ